MIELIGETFPLVDLVIFLSGLGFLVIVKSHRRPTSSWKYVVAAVLCWVGFYLVLGLYDGFVPSRIGQSIAFLLLLGLLYCYIVESIAAYRDLAG
ncbi:hypothetical protein [Natrinema versiforme]|uniref:Uncharacterized protein n=1 Tax=Natrinema versiforme TaxID=88724 RepID=A0A4P8WJX2_9EURY|nr:hypothetical protein [Natrinema versiforme]QCS43788.1 hypothetical protein FEJ81_16040 [Natrinema versiforme]